MIALKIPKKINYKKYRWFVTSSDKLVVGGKSAEQNEELVKMCMKGEHLDFKAIDIKDTGVEANIRMVLNEGQGLI